MNKSGSNGFTLLELMITVVVVGILAAIAYPSYTSYVAQVRRSDASINLSRIAALQERFMTKNGFYAANFGSPESSVAPGTLNAGLTGAAATQDGFYAITIAALPAAEGGTGAIATSYKLTATPLGAQLASDGGVGGKCMTISLSSTGQKTATGTEAATKCWKK